MRGKPLPVDGEGTAEGEGMAKEGGERSGVQGSSEYNLGPDGANICISPLPESWTKYELAERFKRFGNILNTVICQTPSGSYGIIAYDNIVSATQVIQES